MPIIPGTVQVMLYPTPRTDRWEPWILAGLLLVALTAVLILRYL